MFVRQTGMVLRVKTESSRRVMELHRRGEKIDRRSTLSWRHSTRCKGRVTMF
jgi:hypothetical protein